MTASDRQGKQLKVGDLITITAKIIAIESEDRGANIVAVTAIEHGPERKVYSIPCVHGSQVDKVGN